MESILTSNSHFFQRVFTEAERHYCDEKKHKAEHYAARFAAKEAFMKSLGTGWANGITWNEIEVLRDPLGKPFLQLYGETRRVVENHGVLQIHLSLTHTNCCAAAQVILCGQAGV